MRRRFERSNSPHIDETTSNETALTELEQNWIDTSTRLSIIPGKKALNIINQNLQNKYNVNVTNTAIIDAMLIEEIPEEMKELIKSLTNFISSSVE